MDVSPQVAQSFASQVDNDQTSNSDIPLVSILRDTLGDNNPNNDRLLYVWLLSYVHPNIGRHLLSAMPFFYWRIGKGPANLRKGNTKPLLDLTAPEHPVISGVLRQILQSSLLDPTATPLRATSRAYRNNESDYERLHLEQTMTFLREAPISDSGNTLTQTELNSVIARLQLRKSLLGGLVPSSQASHIGEEAGYTQEKTKHYNSEVLRQCAERTGLFFEPLNLAGNQDSYATLWFPLNTAAPPSTGTSLKRIWKLLGIGDPWTNRHFEKNHEIVYTRALDENGSLLPAGSSGTRQVRMVPLGVYSLTYPTVPLLMADFRSDKHLRRREMMQRVVNDATAGVIGISHFSNWYYYAAADFYDFFVSRHGAAMKQSARLDSYAQLRISLALDRKIDPRLKYQIQEQVNSLALNPLEVPPVRELQLARAHYHLLLEQAQNGKLSTRVDGDRRAELAAFGEPVRARIGRTLLHSATFGAYTHRVKQDQGDLAMLDRERRVFYHLNFLDSIAASGTRPEVAYKARRIQDSVTDLGKLMPDVHSPLIIAHITRTLQQVKTNSRDFRLQADCAATIASLQESPQKPAIAATSRGRLPRGVTAFVSSSPHTEPLH